MTMLLFLVVICCSTVVNTGRTPDPINNIKYVDVTMVTGDCVQDLRNILFATGFNSYKDASGRVQSGLQDGGFIWLGQYDECLSLDAGQYCLADIQASVHLQPGNITQQLLRWGLCVPKSCNSTQIEENMQLIVSEILTVDWLRFNQSEVHCAQDLEYNKSFYAAMGCCVLLLSLCIIGSLVEFWHKNSSGMKWKLVYAIDDRGPRLISANGDHTQPASDEAVEWNRPPNIDNIRRAFQHKPGHLTQMLSCFSLFANARLLSQAQTANSVSQNDDVTDIQCLHGMRVISMAWIILGHTFLGLFSSGILDTTINITAYPANVLWQPIGNAYFAVETFFFMSGLLVAYHGSKYLERNEGKINVISFTLQRYLRLLPLMSFMMLLWIGLKPYLGSGPVWYTQQEDPGCDQYWWSNLLFIQNFYPVNLEDACNGWTWFVAVDFQMFLLSPILIVILNKSPRLGLYTCVTLILASIGICATIIIVYDINIDLTQLVMIGDWHGADLYENFIWSKPYNRLPPYITGFILGWYLTKPNQSQPTKITHWLISILACLALAVVVLAFFPLRMGFTYSHVFHATYGSLARCIWGVALSGITWSCIYNNNGFINKFLSCKAFIPLSRLTYGVYLFHPLLIFVIVFNHQSPIPFNDVTIMLHFITFLVLSFVAAAILNLLIEIPIQNLKKFLRSGASPLSE